MSFLSGFFGVLCVAAMAAIVACRFVHLVHFPEWTEAEAMRNLWAVYASAGATVGICFLWFRGER